MKTQEHHRKCALWNDGEHCDCASYRPETCPHCGSLTESGDDYDPPYRYCTDPDCGWQNHPEAQESQGGAR